MQVVKNERTIFVDVDDTLVMHEKHPGNTNLDLVFIPDNINLRTEIKVWCNNSMIRQVKEEFLRGSHIVVWSKGGYQWAEQVLKALDLCNYVHIVMTKPFAYFDDKPAYEWMSERVFLEPSVKYKQTK